MSNWSELSHAPEKRSPALAPPPNGDCWEAVVGVSRSKVFEKSPRIRELLLFVARESLEQRIEHLSEYEIGRAVFGRKDSYVPLEDSIVRSSIRQLRRKLHEYYAHEGRRDAWIIEIPKGSYVAQFRERSQEEIDGLALQLATSINAASNPKQDPVRLPLVLSLCAVLGLSIALNAFLLIGKTPGSGDRALGLAPSLIMDSGQVTQLISDDYAYVLLARMGGHRYSVEDYVSRAYTDPAKAKSQDPVLMDIWTLLTTRYLVSMGSMGTTERILRVVPDLSKIVTKHARNLSGRDFQSGNLILYGSPPNNPWSQLYEDKLNFKIRRNGVNAEFINSAPRPGEASSYAQLSPSSENSGQGYARIAYLPGLSRNSFVLLLTGLNMVTAEAAAEYATNPKYVAEWKRLLGGNVAHPPHFELLLSTSALDSAPSDVKPVLFRRLD